MTLGFKGGVKGKSLNFNKVLSETKLQTVLQKAADVFQRHLIDELEHTSLSQRQKQEIVQSIMIQPTGNGELELLITHPLAGQVEFGSRQFDEQPWMLRAQQSAQQALARKKG